MLFIVHRAIYSRKMFPTRFCSTVRGLVERLNGKGKRHSSVSEQYGPEQIWKLF